MEWYHYLTIFSIAYFLRKFFNGPFTNKRKNMRGKVIVITGSSAGIGKESAIQLLNDEATVIFACRDEKKTKAIIQNLSENISQRAIYINLNLSSFNSVEKFVSELKSKFTSIDVLINNAGGFPDEFVMTEDKIEQTFQANHLSHMYLTYLLLDHFNKIEGRIINVSSYAHFFSNYNDEGLQEDFKDTKFENFKEKYFSNIMRKNSLYGNTKLANVFFTLSLAEYLNNHFTHIKTCSLHPGTVSTEFTRFITNKPFKWIFYLLAPFISFFLKSGISGAQTQLHLTYIDFNEIINGGYYQDCKLTKISQLAKDDRVRELFMKYSMYLINNNGLRKLEL